MVDVEQSGELLSSGSQGVIYKVAADPEYTDKIDSAFVIVKQAMGSPLARWFRDWMIRREYRIYMRLAGIAGIPKCLGLQDDKRLVLEFIEGSPLKLSSGELEDRDRFFSLLLEILQAVHHAGVAHADFKRKDNILVTPDGRPYLIDFGTALTCDEGSGWLRCWMFRQACRIDLNAWVKHKYLGRYEEISSTDAPLYQPTVIERVARPLRRVWRKLTGRQWRKARRKSHS